jgi:hypothetical protein
MPGASIELDATVGEPYRAARAPKESPVVIQTRKGDLLVDSGDPLLRARRSIENLEALKF